MCRGTSLIGAANLSPVTKLVAGIGEVLRYNLSRIQKFIKVQDLSCMQMSVSGCSGHYESVLSAGAKAKSVTNNLPLLSVLAVVIFNYRWQQDMLFPKLFLIINAIVLMATLLNFKNKREII